MTLRRALPLCLLVSAAYTAAGCAAEGKGKTEIGTGIPLVEFQLCRALPYRPVIKGFGSIEPVRRAEILPPMTETLVEMYRREGDLIAEGESLARLDSRALRLRLSEQKSAREGCRAALRLAEEKYRKALREKEGRFLSIRSAEAECRKARAELHRMQEVLRHKRSLFQADGVTAEELQAAELALMEKEILLDQAECSLASLSIGFRRQDLLAAGFAVPEGDLTGINGDIDNRETWKDLYLDLNTRMELAECDLARAELNEAERRIASLELRIEECMIRSPLEGIVGRRYRDEGEMVSPDKALYTLYPGDPVHALISLSEKDHLKVDPGMEALVISDALNERRTGIVDRVSPWISSETGSGELRILLENPEGRFRIGQFVRVEIALAEKSFRIMIPASAVLEEGEDRASQKGEDRNSPQGGASVFLLKGKRIFRRDLVTGLPEEEGVPVLQGLEEGEAVVLSPVEGLRDGMEVRIR